MRRASIVLFVLAFTAMSEGEALCLMMLPGTAGNNHGCCLDRAASPTSVKTCCAISQSDRDTAPSSQADATAIAVSNRQVTFFYQPDTGASAELRSSSDFRSGSAPLYLQHLSLLI